MRQKANSILFSALVVLILAVAVPVAAQNPYSYERHPAKNIFAVDYAYFKTDRPDSNRFELYYKIHNAALQFVRDGDGFSAGYELYVTVYDDDDRQHTALSRERDLHVDSYAATISPDDFRISQINFGLAPGKYKVEFQLYDINSQATLKQSLQADLTEFSSRNPQLSGIELVHSVDTTVVDSVFAKGDIAVIPGVSRLYSGDSTAHLFFYHEIYQGSGETDEFDLVTRILDRKLNSVYGDTISNSFGDEDNMIRQLRRIPLAGLKSGEYSLEVSILGRRNRVVDRVDVPFRIYWSPEALILYEPEKAISQLKYFAEPRDVRAMTAEEEDGLKEASSAEERVRRWNEFWAVRDPSPGTTDNELKNEFFNRVEFVNRNFSVMRKEGWQTDRGRIFLQFGEPDQVENFPFELNQKAHQIWYYYHLKELRKFIFVDEWNDGDYRLQFPYDGRSW